MTDTDEFVTIADSIVPQGFRRQLLARAVVLGVGYALSKAAKDLAQEAGKLLALAWGPTANLPALATPAERKRARAALAAAATIVDQAPADLDDDGPDVAYLVCGAWFTAFEDGLRHKCDRFGPLLVETHVHARGKVVHGWLYNEATDDRDRRTALLEEAQLLEEAPEQPGRLGVEPLEAPADVEE